MFLKIIHETYYTYSDKIFLEPQQLFFKPLYRSYLSLKNFNITVDPNPAGLSERLDQENNLYLQFWQNGLTDYLKIKVLMELESKPFNPFGFLETQSNPSLTESILNIYSTPLENFDKEIISFGEKIKNSSESVSTFVTNLLGEIYSLIDHSARYEPNLLSPEECFFARKGSCRDISWLMINILRHFGIPSRFVGGYSFNPELEEGHELHAWVDYWTPGAGWIGVDPSAGLYVTEYYIPVATSYHPSLTLPVQGAFRGKATSTLDTKVQIEKVE